MMTGGNVKEDKITPSDLEAHAQVLIEMGLMPSLETVLDAVADTRKKYVPKIEAARQGQMEAPREARHLIFEEK
jgi:hypothetical protein